MRAIASSVQEAGIPLEITVWNMEKTGISKVSFKELSVSDAGYSGWKQCEYEPLTCLRAGDDALVVPRRNGLLLCRYVFGPVASSCSARVRASH